MGERYQIHIRVNDLDEKEQYHLSIHLQWCWEVHIIRNLNRLLTTLSKTRYEHIKYYKHELNKFIEGILTVNKSLGGHYYPYGVHVEEPYTTFQGDSNHGWAVVFIDKKKNNLWKVKSRFYDINGQPKSNEELWQDCFNPFEYYNWKKEDKDKLKKLLVKRRFNNTEEDLQKIFNKEVEKLDKKEVEV